MHMFKTLRYFGYFKRHPWFYPKYLWHMIMSFLGRAQIWNVEIFFDPICNFSCWHCSSFGWVNKKERTGLTIGELKTIIHNLKTAGVLSICYVGGEPTTRTDLEEIIRMTNRYKVLPTIITNAFLLTEDKIDKLFAAGLANMGFSLQSMDKEVHDRLVNHPGAFDRMISAIDYCVRKKYVCSICVVPTNENIKNGDFDRLVGFASQKQIRMNVNLPAPVGKLIDDTDNILNKESVGRLIGKYFELPNFLPDFKISDKKLKVRCPMGERAVYIFPDGEVCPCTFVHISFGNALHEPMHKIMDRMVESPLLKSVNREGQCPISMDIDFINKVKTIIKNTKSVPVKSYRIN